MVANSNSADCKDVTFPDSAADSARCAGEQHYTSRILWYPAYISPLHPDSECDITSVQEELVEEELHLPQSRASKKGSRYETFPDRDVHRGGGIGFRRVRGLWLRLVPHAAKTSFRV